jgi:hypothetical protein
MLNSFACSRRDFKGWADKNFDDEGEMQAAGDFGVSGRLMIGDR